MSLETGNSTVLIRRANEAEAELLSDLALRSKSHWDYDAEFLEACRAELTISPEAISASPIFVLETSGQLVGFYGLREEGDGMELLYLFVEPSEINRGYGKLLWKHALATASSLGFREITIESDPYAEAFYRAMGARRIGLIPSSVQFGRNLPLLEFSLPQIQNTR